MTPPRVSVCIPTYNGAPYIERTIRSVLAQTWDDFELVVRDDGSTDDTVKLVRGFDDPRIRIVAAGERGGAAANFRHSAELATGTWFKLLCQDDVLYPDCLDRQVAALETSADDGVVMVACRRDIVDDDDRVIFPARGWRGASGRIAGTKAMRANVRAGTNLVGEPSAVLCSREAFLAAGGFDPTFSYMIDLEAWLRLLARGDLVYLPEALCTFRVSARSWSAQLARDQARQARAVMRSARDRWPDMVTQADLAIGWPKPTVLSLARRAVFASRQALPNRRAHTSTSAAPPRSVDVS